MTQLGLVFADGAVVAKRNLIKIRRVPEILIWTTMSPIMFVLLFALVFGNAIEVPGIDYKEYLIAGIFAQTVLFGSTFTGAGLAEDMTKGIIDRFRSLPMSQSAVLFGRTGSDIVYNSTSIFVMTITGLIVGWRIRTGPLEAIEGFLLLLLFAYAVSWIMAFVGLKVASVEVVNNASFMFIFPMTFIANTFVRSDLLPGPLRTFAEWNPVSAVAQAVREAFGNTGSLPEPDVWSLAHPVAYTLIWVAIILAIFVPLSVRQYKRAASRSR
jgi:ABC-2 type transport system permease protein